MTTRFSVILLLASLLVAASVDAEDRRVTVTREVYLMGTSATLSVHAPRGDGIAALERALRILEATEDELSTWRPHSAISQLNRQPVGEPWHAGEPLCGMLARVEEWYRVTGGAFDPAIGALIDAWDIHGNGRVPSPVELEAARRRSGWHRIGIDRERCLLTRHADVRIDVGAFGKGEALDRVAAVLGNGMPWIIDLGGQISAGGLEPDARPFTVAIAHPKDRRVPFLQIRMRHGSLATSAGSERDLAVGGRRVGHVLDPKTGEPAPFGGSVTVWHEQGLAADALSTALYVMGPELGLPWAERHGISVCFLVPDDRGGVRTEMTPSFRLLVTGPG